MADIGHRTVPYVDDYDDADDSPLQVEADLLKKTAVGAVKTKVIVLGIGVSRTEANNIASAPQSRNAILVSNFNSLTAVEYRLTSASCAGE